MLLWGWWQVVLVLVGLAKAEVVLRSPILKQDRQPFPEHKRRSLQASHGIDYEGRMPLRTGYGTHFAFIYVGKPEPQRVSVILDTGSHWMAFPCTGCK